MRHSVVFPLALCALLVACSDSEWEDEPDATLEVEEIYEDSPLDWLRTRLSSDRVQAGDSVFAFCEGQDTQGNPFVLDDDEEVVWIVEPEDALEPADRPGEWTARVAGEVKVSCELADLSLVDARGARLVVRPGAPYRVTTSLPANIFRVGDLSAVECQAFDAWDNPASSRQFEILTTPAGIRVSETALRVHFDQAGDFEVTCSLPGASLLEGESVRVTTGLPYTVSLEALPYQPLYGVGDIVSLAWTVLDERGITIPNEALDLRFSASPLGAEALDDARFRFDEEGLYTLTVTVMPPTGVGSGAEPLEASVELRVGSQLSEIVCDFPLNGSSLDTVLGAAVQFEAHTGRAAALASALVNGADAVLGEDGGFSLSVDAEFGHNFVHLQTLDELGVVSVRTCVFVAADGWVLEGEFLHDALGLVLGSGAIGGAGSGASDLLASLNDVLLSTLLHSSVETEISATLGRLGTILPSVCVGLPGACLIRADVSLGSVSLPNPVISRLTLAEGGLELEVELPVLEVGIQGRGGVTVDATARIEGLKVVAALDVELVTGRPRVQLRQFVRQETARVDFLALGALEPVLALVRTAFDEVVLGALYNVLRNHAREPLVTTLDAMFSGMHVPTLVEPLAVSRLDGSGEILLQAATRFSGLNFSSERGLIGLGTVFASGSSSGSSGSGIAVPPGSHATASPQVARAWTHTGALNQMIHTLWRKRFFEPRWRGAAAGLAEDVEFKLYAGLPPLVQLASGPSLEFHLGGLQARITDPDEWEEPKFFELGIKLQLSLESQAGEVPSFGPATILDAYFYPLSEGVSESATDRWTLQAEELLSGLAADTLAGIFSHFHNPAFPLPRTGLPPTVVSGSLLGVGADQLEIAAPTLAVDGNLAVVPPGR